MTNTSTRPGFRDSLVALRIPAFRRFFVAALVSNSGAWLQGLAMPFVMFHITGSGAWVGASVFALSLPMAVTGLVAGPLADRLPRRNILLVTQVTLAVIAIGYAVAWWTGVRSPWAYLTLSILYGTVNGFNMPAWQAFVADLVPRDALMNAITLNSTQFNAARALGPSIGGVVLASLGPGWAFAGNAASFVAVVSVLTTLPATQASTPSPTASRHRRMVVPSALQQFGQGLRYVRTQPGIVTGYIAAAGVAFLGGTLVQVHLVLFAEQVFEVSEFWFGVLVSAFGVGALLVVPLLTTVAPQYRRSGVLIVGLAAYGLAELVLVSTAVFAVGAAGVLLAGAAHLTMATTTNTTVQLQVDEAMRGRVMAMYLMVFTLAMPIGAIIQGPLADAIGPRTVVLAMGLSMLGLTGWLVTSGRAQTFDQ